MKRINWFFAAIIFLLVGELFVRFDKETKIFEKDDVVKISTKTGINEELELLNKKKVPLSDSVLRIMVLGDSYIYGGGIDLNKNFSHQLKTLLLKSNVLPNKEIHVLDVSRPSNNNLDNYNTYFKYVNEFKPQVVILGYNLNDIKDNLEKDAADTMIDKKTDFLPVKSVEKKNLLQKTYNFFWKSELLSFLSKNFYNYLKSLGIIIPNTGFDEKLSAYVLNKPSWVKSKKLLSEVFIDANKSNIKFILLLMPEIDLLEHPKIFYSADTVFSHFLNPFQNLIFVNGRDIFKNQSSKEFCLSKYDGHPNEEGHLVMARYISKVVEKNQSSLRLSTNGTRH
jgi:hypothetical protein